MTETPTYLRAHTVTFYVYCVQYFKCFGHIDKTQSQIMIKLIVPIYKEIIMLCGMTCKHTHTYSHSLIHVCTCLVHVRTCPQHCVPLSTSLHLPLAVVWYVAPVSFSLS